METEVTTTDQVTGQEPQQESQNDSNVDYKALYLDEVSNSKKLRKRSQEAEAKVTEFTKSQETQRVKQMKEQEKFQELSEELQKQLDSALPYKERWEDHENTTRENLLSKLPKADREKLSNEKLETLKYIVGLQTKVEESPEPPKHTPGRSRNIEDVPDGNIFSLPQEERKKHWDAYMSNLAKKNN